jgi:exopolyphosphatase/guanosine-5'-triphosphate,3'-diphosphate pyrophosphatase
MTRAAIDIGTNSMRLLIVDDEGHDLVRLAKVTGLGRGTDASGKLSDEAIERTIVVFEEFGRLCDEHGVDRRRAVATSATRDAGNRDEFLARAESALGVRPEAISGVEEAELAYFGATRGRSGDFAVVDIGGGSTEFVFRTDEINAVSIDIGSVRLTDRLLFERPATFEAVESAAAHVERMFAEVAVPDGSRIIGVAGTWTSLAAIIAGREGSVHDSVIDRLSADRLVARLAGLTVEETERLPGLDPARAPVILAGAVIARQVLRTLDVPEVAVSERDLLDGIVAGV